MRAEVPALGLFGPAVPLVVTGGPWRRRREGSRPADGAVERTGDGLRDQRGSAIVEFVWLGLILLVPLVWVVLSVFEVQRGAFGVSGGGAGRGAGLRAGPRPTPRASGGPGPRRDRRWPTRGCRPTCRSRCGSRCESPGSTCHSGGAVITVRVDSRVDLPLLPDVLGGGRPGFALDASHTVPIGQYQEVR